MIHDSCFMIHDGDEDEEDEDLVRVEMVKLEFPKIGPTQAHVIWPVTKLGCVWGNSKWERRNVGCVSHEAKTTKK